MLHKNPDSFKLISHGFNAESPLLASLICLKKCICELLSVSLSSRYETSNGISHEEQGHVVNAGAENEAIAVSGSFKYTGADGVTYTVNYVADENGFQPEGAHLPVPEHH